MTFAAINAIEHDTPPELPRVRCRGNVTPERAPGLIGRTRGRLSMKRIPLSQGKIAFVDDEDFVRLSWFQWFAYQSESGIWYARRNTDLGEPRKTVLMHRAVFGITELDPDIDHRDGDGLNNQKVNLRLATRSGNAANIKVRKDSQSGLKGVYWAPRHKKYSAQITTGGKQIWLGYFKTAEEAARAFDRAAIKHHGEFARTNFPLEQYT